MSNDDRHHTTAADLTDGLKRLKMAGMRRLAPELLITAKTQRWNPEEFLRTLIEAGITARNASNARTRRRQACFPRAGPAAMLPGDRPGPFLARLNRDGAMC